MKEEFGLLLIALCSGALGVYFLSRRGDDGSGMLLGPAFFFIAFALAAIALLTLLAAVRFD